MSDASDALDGARQLRAASTWGKTPRKLAGEYNPDAPDQYARASIEKAALELAQKLPSRSAFRDNDNPVDTLAGLTINVDARIHEFINIYYALELGYQPAIDLLKAHQDSPLAAAAIAKIEGK
jgi:hypothetical protein